MYQIKMTYPEHSALYVPGGKMLPHYCKTLKEFAETVVSFYADSCKYAIIGGRLYDDDTIMHGDTEEDGYLIPSGAVYYIDMDKPETEYCLKDLIHYEAIQIGD